MGQNFAATCYLVSLALSGCHFIGCHALPQTTRASLFAHKLQCEQIVLHSDFELVEHQLLVEELCAQRGRLASKLRLPTTDQPIHIYLFASDTSYYDFLNLRFPGFPHRRAIFVETEVELAVYAHWGDHIAEDLRHEVTHGYLHAALPNLPLWLDEGLAEYYEVGGTSQGFHSSHVDQLNGIEDFAPNLRRLEQLSTPAEMTQRDYAESWAWVHFLLETDVDMAALLTDYLADLQQGATTMLSTQLQQRLAGLELAMQEHLQTLQRK